MTEPSPAPATLPTQPAGVLPSVDTPLSAVEVVSRLDQAARRGKLPGFHKSSETGLFYISDFGTPFESFLNARSQNTPAGTTLHFDLRLKPTMPWAFFATLVLSVWPGVWLTHSMLQTYFSGYTLSIWGTCVWYLPLTVPFVPIGMLQALRKSRASARTEALELIQKIRGILALPVAS